MFEPEMKILIIGNLISSGGDAKKRTNEFTSNLENRIKMLNFILLAFHI